MATTSNVAPNGNGARLSYHHALLLHQAQGTGNGPMIRLAYHDCHSSGVTGRRSPFEACFIICPGQRVQNRPLVFSHSHVDSLFSGYVDSLLFGRNTFRTGWGVPVVAIDKPSDGVQ